MGWNGSNSGSSAVVKDEGRKPSAKAAPSFKKGIIAGLVVVIGAGVVFWYIGSKDTSKPTKEKKSATKQIAEVKPQIVTQAIEQVVETPKETPQQKAKRERIEMLKSMTKEERIEFVFREVEKRPINLEPASNRAYATGLEQVMDWVFTTEVGDVPPPLPAIPHCEEAHLIEILAHKNEIRETDSDRVKEGKETVMLAKEEFVNFLTEGGDPQDFLPYYHDKLREAHTQYEETRKSVMELAREEPELVPEYLETVNKSLEDKGIKPVTIPRPLAKHLGLQLDDKYLLGAEKE